MDCPVPVEENGKWVYKKASDQIDKLSWEYIRGYGFYERGFLPNGTGWGKESNKYLEAMQTIDNEYAKNTTPVPKEKA